MLGTQSESRRKRAAQKSQDPMVVAKAALQLAKSLRSEVERKRVQQITTQTNYLAGVVTLVSGIAQGDGVSGRTGDSVRLQNLDLRVNFATFTDSTVAWRMIVFSDRRQVAGTNPTVTQVLDTDSAISAFALGTADRWLVLKDVTIDQNARFLNGDMSNVLVCRIPLNNLVARWNAGTTTAGQVYVLITCDVASTASMVGKPAAGDAATRFTADLSYTDA